MARGRRRKRVEEALDEERARQAALLEQLEEIVAEEIGSQVDERAFAQMDPEDVALVRGLLQAESPLADEDDDFLTFEEDDAEVERELDRLQAEIEASQRRQLAYERYLEALGSAPALSE